MSLLLQSLNAAALVGWAAVLAAVALNFNDVAALLAFSPLFLALEGICWLEVARIGMGLANGNLVLGVIVHAIRVFVVLHIMPSLPSDVDLPLTVLVLVAWGVTEVTRYPMYLMPESAAARILRAVVPVVTFPLGCAGEGFAAWRVLDLASVTKDPAQVLVVAVLLVNGFLGPTLGFPAILKKARQALKGGKGKGTKGKKPL